MYKLLLLDVDGTLVESNGEAMPSQAVIKAVKAAQKHLTVAIATGRPIHLTQHVIDALGLTGPSVFNGGAEILEIGTKKELHRQEMSVKELREVVRLALPFGYDVYVEEEQYSKPFTKPEDVTKPSAKLLIEAVRTPDALAILEELNAVEGIVAQLATSWRKGDFIDIHVNHEHATKRYGVEELMDLLGVSKAETMAIGDGHNDLPMLEAAGFKVVMGNAPKEVKTYADFVAPPLEEDGVAAAIQKFILN